MKWIELTVLTTSEASDIVADILTELGSDGVSIFDTNDLAEVLKSDIIWDYVDEHLLINDATVRVKGYYNAESIEGVLDDLYLALSHLRLNSDMQLGSLEVISKEIDEEDWVNVWRQYYKPIHIGNIVIVPCWLKYTPLPSEVVVLIDPGKAFGTGEHESTRLCLKMFSQLKSAGKVVLDIGCGSGILGIAAAKAGATKVFLSDIDPVATECARENANLNSADNVIIECCDLIAKADFRGDIIFANITADILIMLSGSIGNVLNNGGYIILSGIIKKRYDDVLTAYSNQGYKVVQSEIMGEWCGITLQAE